MTRRPGILGVAAVSAGLFLALLGLLALQVRTGRDPALGEGSSAPTPAARRVLVRRIIERRVVVHVIPAPGAAAGSAPAPTATSAPTAPVAAAPAPAPAPSPVTRTS